MKRGILLVCCLSAFLTAPVRAEDAMKYPPTRQAPVTDEFHGTQVTDPYRWLEDDVRKSKDVAAWVEAQNKVTFGFLEKIPVRKALQKRITELWDYERFSAPFKTGGRYFYFRNDGLQNQAVLYTTGDRLDGEPRVLLDPNKLSGDGTVALTSVEVSPNGRLLAYGLAEAGSDWQTWRIMDVDTGKTREEDLKWIKFSSAAWTRDSKGFFYSRFDEPTGSKFTSLNLNQKVYYHRVGTSQADDVLVYRRPDHPEWGFSTAVSEDGRYLILTVWKGTDHRYRITYRDLDEPYGLPVDLIDDFNNEYTFLDNDGPIFYFKTDLNAPLGRVIAIDVRKPDRKHWKEVLPQAKEQLAGVSVVGNLLVCTYLKDARSVVKMYTLAGTHVRDVQLPGIGTASGFGGKRSDTETFYTFSSFATPPSIYRYDLATGISRQFRTSKVKFNPDDYVVEQVFFQSKDGTRVPMFITRRKDIKLDGTNPTILYGYGGFNISLTPNFAISRIAWLELGGIYAQVNLRGGGEYGKEWHQAGTRLRKQNVFNDFIAAAEYLVEHKYTAREKLAIKGGSNGGLLVGACLTQRPDLFGACLPAVGVMDMLRFHKFTAGRYWVDDYGTPDNPEEFKALRAYSPYHNLKKGVKYPATLVTTADTDDRVVPGHSFKFAALLQHCQAGSAPVLIRIETKAGHGAGKPTAKLIEELADEYAFLVKTLNVTRAGQLLRAAAKQES
ncbi:MAG: prolyl oligopeptidase family serine peptidase [Gemmataceae bacterium]